VYLRSLKDFVMVNIPNPFAQPITLEHYLEEEEKREERHEYVNGKVIKMAGGTSFHAIIIFNIAFSLRIALGEAYDRFHIVVNDLKVWIEQFNSARYPDIMLIEDEMKYHGEGYTVITNPSIIVEVLSSSTQKVDEGIKFEEYRSLDSLQSYILVHQDKPMVTLYEREAPDLWRIRNAQGLESSIHIPSLNLDLPLSQVYAQINFL
jgi:Uma2 family endonuclease